MEEPEDFRLYDLVVYAETGEVGVIVELRSSFARIQFPAGVKFIEYLDLHILRRDAPIYPLSHYENTPFRRNRDDLP